MKTGIRSYGFFGEKREKENGPLSWLPFGPYPPAVAFDNSLNHGQTDSRAVKFVVMVKPPEDTEKFCGILGAKTDSAIAHKEGSHALIGIPGGKHSDFNDCQGLTECKLDHTGYQFGEGLVDHGRIGLHPRQRMNLPADLPF
jgi:hypothetical protein